MGIRQPLVAVLDDDDEFADLMEVLLEDEGYRSTRPSLTPGDDLADVLVTSGCDLAIVDLRGVAGDDLRVLERMRQDARVEELPILVCSADVQVLRDNAQLLSRLPHVAALEKPFRIDALAGTLERLLAGASPLARAGGHPDGAAVAALQAWLERVGSSIRWAVLDAWVPDERAGLLRCVAAWCAADRFDPFVRVSRRTYLPFGGGLPGRVWVSGRPTWIEEVGRDLNFPRQSTARRVGLVSAIAAPVLDGDATIGVVAAYHTLRRPYDVAVADDLALTVARSIDLFRAVVDPGGTRPGA